jgi:hypothetical protein
VQNPFADLVPNQQAHPRVIVGTPRPREAPQRAPQTAEEIEADRLQNEQRRLDIEHRRREADAGPSAQAAEAERKAASFLIRAIGSNQDYENTGVGPRSLPGQIAADAFPNVAYANADPARQTAESAQNEFIAATLRMDSGAAIPPEEIETQRQIYFPRPGASEEAINQARRARQRAVAGLLNSAGRATTPQMRAAAERYLQAFDERNDIAAGQASPGTHAEFGGDNAPPPTPPGAERFQAELQQAIQSGQIRTPPEILAFAQQRGFNISPEEAIAASRANGRVQVNTPQFQGEDVSAQRGAQADPGAQMLENSAYSAIPIVGAMSQGIQGLAGPESANAFLRGGADVATFGGADEFRAGVQSLGNGQYDANLRRQNALDDYDTQNNFGARLGGQLAAGAPMALVGGSALGRQVVASGAQGLAYGFGSGRDGFSDRAQNALVGGAIGAGLPVAMRGASSAIREVPDWLRGRAVTDAGREIAQAADQEGVTISRPIAEPAARRRMGNLQASVGGAGPVDRSLAATAAGIEERAGQLGAGGAAQERGSMGQRVQTAVNANLQGAKNVARRIYDQAAQRAGNAPIQATEAVSVLDRQIAELSENAGQNRELIGYLNTVRGDLVDEAGNARPKTIGAIRDLRTGMSGEINRRNLGHTNAERLVSEALDAAGADITRDLGQASPEALALYNRGDRMWRVQAENRRQIVERLTGPADNPIMGAAVMDRLQSAASGSTPHFRRMWAMLPPQDRLDAAATIAARAGRRSPDEAFSPAQFIAWARTLPDSARQVAFGPEGARSIANLSRLSRELIDTRAALNNSKSGVVRNYAAFFRNLVSGGAPGALLGAMGGSTMTGTAAGLAVGATATAGGAAIRNLSARALMSPDMSRWIAAGARMSNPSSIRAHIGRLSSIAARDPAIAQEVTGLRQALLRAANDNTMAQAAASPNEGQGDQR